MAVRGLIVAALFALVLTATAAGHQPPDVRGGGPVAGAASTAETVALRQRYFGVENVDPRTGAVRRDRTILSWVGVTNFAMAIRGHVVLLDAWVPRGAHSGYVPSSPDELAKLAPEAILIGHAHFDHAADAVPIAQASGATIVGSAEQCAELRGRVAAIPPPCVEALPPGAEPGTTAQVPVLSGVETTIVKHVHSGAKQPNGEDSGGYHVPVAPPPSTTQVEHPATPQDMAQLVEHAPDAEAGTVLYRFRVGDFSMIWHDSAGPLTEEAPQAYDVFRSLRPIDVQVGAIQGFNQLGNGMRDPRLYIEAFAPSLFVPAHHDDWAAGITTKGENYRAPLNAELERIPPEQRPRVRFIADPTDYVRPEVLTFPVVLDAPRLERSCAGRRVHARITGDLAGVASVTFRLGRRTRTDTAAPFEHTFRRRTKGRRVVAVATDVEGAARTLRRRAPRC